MFHFLKLTKAAFSSAVLFGATVSGAQAATFELEFTGTATNKLGIYNIVVPPTAN